MTRYDEQAERLQEVKAYLGLTHDKDLATPLGVSQSSVSSYVNGHTLSLASVISLYKKHKINPLWLLFGRGPMVEDGNISDFEAIRAQVLSLETAQKIELLRDLMNELKGQI